MRDIDRLAKSDEYLLRRFEQEQDELEVERLAEEARIARDIDRAWAEYMNPDEAESEGRRPVSPDEMWGRLDPDEEFDRLLEDHRDPLD